METFSTEPMEARRTFLRNCHSLSPLFVCLFAFAAGARAVSGPHGTVDLVSEQTSIRPGHNFRVGLHFQLEKGWHIYWLNPGDSGEPPKVQWNLPAGFRAGPLEWPTPRRIEDHSLIDYGYEDEVLLPIEIRPPGRFAAVASVSTTPPSADGLPSSTEEGTKGWWAERTVTLEAAVTWLVCREICIPGRATLTLTLPVRKDAPDLPSAARELFAKVRTELPKPTPKHWKMTGRLEGREFILDVEIGRREASGTFFPLEPNQIENAAPQNASPIPRGIRLKLRRSDQMLKPVATLAGVLVLNSARSYVIKVPIHTSNSH